MDKKQTKKKSAAKKPTAVRSASSEAKQTTIKDNRAAAAIMPFVLIFVAVFVFACLLIPGVTGLLGAWLKDLLLGWFSLGAYLIPPLIVFRAVFFRRELRDGGMVSRWLISLLSTALLGTFFGVFFAYPDRFDAGVLFDGGKALNGGGVVGGGLGMLMSSVIGPVATGIISGVLLLVCLVFLVGRSPTRMFERGGEIAAEKFTDARDNAKDRRLARQDERRRRAEAAQRLLEENGKKEPEPERKTYRISSRRKKDFVVDVEGVGKTEPPADAQDGELPGFEIPVTAQAAAASAATAPSAPEAEIPAVQEKTEPTGQDILTDVFSRSEDAELTDRFGGDDPDEGVEAQTQIPVKRETLRDQPEEEEREPEKTPEEAAPSYHFPPLSLLKYEPVRKGINTSEQEHTAEKLVETLASFGVRTKILDIAVGPTVTRYELQPEAGVRVRSIVNLADDIALGLASSGVRIEAPIPGKEAVGIEVPNKTVATVYLRELLENPAFTSADCRLNVCLGMDVAGDPVYCNITKMPHLLIAGATNMGKSVCINSIITSVLYKARPDEVKMILVDPKKVEMSMYNGIPHLIVPTVSEPKKAAGALAWAVNEMERRYALMEEMSTRNIAGYNKAVENDPERTKEPLILIVIDELADLMMTARDEVESSICRLAQKARAAGMHLVIGTQRPSVDVITGLIKANFPSRIAFTVSSQIDSRTIIDTVGAEKLIGRGDMLYAPVGATKPTRVQGAFVSESEVEAITDFLREQRTAQYSQEIQEQIEKEAARCGEKKHGAGFDADPDNMGGENAENDPMLPQAIRIAIENGKISTSFIQRKLQLGYSRAGRITDAMGNMGVIGPFNGSKPREVLWSMDRYMEWMNSRGEQSSQ